MTFMTNDEWATKKGYASLAAYLLQNTYPTAAGLTAMREEAYGIMYRFIQGDPGTNDLLYLRGLEYRMVELMMDEEQGRLTQTGRNIYIPRDYLYDRDRDYLSSIGGEIAGFGWGS